MSQAVTSERDPVAASRTPRVAVVSVVASLAAVVFIMAVTIAMGSIGAIAFSLIPMLLIVDMALVGGLLAIRRPDNAIGSLLLGVGLLAAVSFGASYYARLDSLIDGGRLPFVVPVAWIGTWVFIPAIGLLVVFLPMLYPTGHLPGPRWRILAGVTIVALSIGTLQSATAPGPLNSADWIVNPVRLPAPLVDWITAIGTISRLTAPPAFLIAVAGLMARFRASRGAERQQLKWFLYVASITAIALGLSIFSAGPVSDAAWAVGLIAMGFLPVAIGIAILRYRLYEIDRIISRTIGWAVLTGILGLAFLALVLGLQVVLAPLTRSNGLALATSTLVVAAAFAPARRRVQAIVDRRFDRARYDAAREIAGFTVRVRDEVDVEQLTSTLSATLMRTMQPATASIWLRSRNRP
jgi:hypothetical protein